MKVYKLNSRGFSHDIMIVLFVAIFAIGGVAYLVASHADSCVDNNVSGPVSVSASQAVSSASSGPASSSCQTPVSVAASSVVSSPAVSGSGSCALTGIPTSVAAGTLITPTLTVTNTGATSLAPAMIAFAAQSNSASTYFTVPSFSAIAPGQAVNAKIGSYTVPNAVGSVVQILAHSDVNAAGTQNASFSCAQSFTITPPATAPSSPVKPAITAKPIVPTKLAARCSITGTPGVLKYGQMAFPMLNVTNTGNVAFRPQLQSQLLVVTGKTVSYNLNRTLTLPTLQPGQTSRQPLLAYRAPSHTKQAIGVTYRIASSSPQFSCSDHLAVPSSSMWGRFF